MGGFWRELDWQLISFVAGSLAQEFKISWHLPRIYYWQGERGRGGGSQGEDSDHGEDHHKAA